MAMEKKRDEVIFHLHHSRAFFAGIKGFILPLLFSAKSDEALFLGVVVLVITPVLFWLLWRIAKREIQRKKK